MALKRPVYSVRAENKGFTVYRDDKALQTPLHFPLAVPMRALAEAIAQEFEAPGAKSDLRKMPITQMTLTTIDISSPRRKEIIAGTLKTNTPMASSNATGQ